MELETLLVFLNCSIVSSKQSTGEEGDDIERFFEAVWLVLVRKPET